MSSTSRLSEAKGLVLPPIGTCPDHIETRRGRLIESGILVDGAWNHAMRVAEGSVDVYVHFGGGPWDHAAAVVIVEEAGGRFTDLWGGRRIDTGTALFSNSALQHDLYQLLAE